MKKYSLVRTFTLYSLITFLTIGTILAFVISKHIKSDYYESLYGVIDIVVNNITENILDESDFSKSIEDSKGLIIEEEINKALAQYMPRSFVLLNIKNEVVFMNKKYISRLSENELKGIDIIRQNNVSYNVSDSYFETDSDKTSVFNFTVPIKYEENIVGLLLLQFPEVVVNSHVNMLLRSIVLTMLGGLLILFLFVNRILYSASKTLRIQNEELVKQKVEIESAYKMLTDSYKSTIMTLSNAVDARDSYTAGHSERVARISLMIGKQMKLSLQDVKELEYAALFHDIGKIGIPDDILLKSSKLTDEEYTVIQRHPVLGVNILKSIEFLKEILPIVKHHHERYDGKGYPDKMLRDDIPLCSRIIAVADTYDAMTSDRPYRKRLAHQVAVSEIVKNKGMQFDPNVVDAFMLIENSIE